MKETRVYEVALGPSAANNPLAKRLGMAGPLVRVLPESVVGHEEEAKPHRKDQAQAPGEDDAPEYPVGHAENEDDAGRIALVAHEIAGRHAPNQGQQPHAQKQPAFTAGVAEETLFFAGILLHGR